MLPTTHNVVHQLIEQTVHVGDTTIDGTTANGINTRFLATRVGPSGRVLSYTATKDNANAAAASLFMSGLSERVTLLGKTIDRQFITELGPQSQARIAIFAQNAADRPVDYLDQINHVLPRLTHGGLLIVLFSETPADWQTYQKSLLKAVYQQAAYLTEAAQAYLIERI